MSAGVYVMCRKGAHALAATQELDIQPLRYGRWVMIGKLIEAVFGCRHSRYSFPVNVRRAKRRPQAAALTGTYVVCLDCGKEFAYDWQEMKVITSPEEHREHLAELAKHAA
ncbi:MAG TPA: hypothetical protein VM715_08015 [Candidatus Acidoferrum sp.]|jgi:hypothetical protein|nr:hypothetical protein [Candidatus Acidoferrum sp.]